MKNQFRYLLWLQYLKRSNIHLSCGLCSDISTGKCLAHQTLSDPVKCNCTSPAEGRNRSSSYTDTMAESSFYGRLQESSSLCDASNIVMDCFAFHLKSKLQAIKASEYCQYSINCSDYTLLIPSLAPCCCVPHPWMLHVKEPIFFTRTRVRRCKASCLILSLSTE